VIVVVLALIATVNLVGVRDVAVVTDVLTVAKMLPLLLFIAVGLFYVDPQSFSFAASPGYSDFSKSVLVLVYAFTGFEMAVIPAGEVSDPRRYVPKAILIAIGVVALLYVLIQVVCVGTLPGLAASERPLADASGAFLGAAGASIISAGALLSILPNLNVIILAGSRLPFAMAGRRELPSPLAATHPRFHTPHFSILLTAAIVLVMTLSGTFIYAVTISAIARLIAYAGTCAALPVLRRKRDAAAAMFKVRSGGVVAIACLLLIVWLLSNSTLREARDAGIAAAAGFAVYFVGLLIRRRQTQAAKLATP
jgi:amino acid transporter